MAPGQEALNPQVIQCHSLPPLSLHYQTHKADILFPIKENNVITKSTMEATLKGHMRFGLHGGYQSFSEVFKAR